MVEQANPSAEAVSGGAPRKSGPAVAVFRRFGRKAWEGLRAWRQRGELARELSGLTDGELRDAGFARSEIPLVVRNHPLSSELRRRMMERLGIDEEAAWRRFPGLMRAIHRACALCAERKACRRWLDFEEPGHGYRLFCPNAVELAAIKDSQAPAAARPETGAAGRPRQPTAAELEFARARDAAPAEPEAPPRPPEILPFRPGA
jgi:uncharacterized protein YjiS (DUF1127 family)